MAASNLIWIVVDSIRGDRTPMGGHSRRTTPNMEQLGADETGVATTCFSHAVWSQPSVASMLTGTYPSYHGSGLHNDVLPAEIPTVAERLSEAGFGTRALSVNNYFSESTGTARGFDDFEELDLPGLFRENSLGGFISFLKEIRKFSGGFSLQKQKHHPDYLANQIAKDHLSELADCNASFFFCAHYHGTHHPYYPAPAFQSRFSLPHGISTKEAAEKVLEVTNETWQQIAEGVPLSSTELEIVRTMYDALMAQSDAIIGRLLDYIERLGLGDESIVVVTSDHGELLGEYNLLSHAFRVSDELIKVPIAIRGSDRLIDADLGMVQHIDIMQTILDELGASTEGMQGRLLPDERPEYAVAQRGDERRQLRLGRVQEHNAEFSHELIRSGLVTGVRTADWKLVESDEGRVLYELPDEATDVLQRYPEKAEEMGKHLDEWREENGGSISSAQKGRFDEKTKERLSDLGYVVE